MKLGVSIGFPS